MLLLSTYSYGDILLEPHFGYNVKGSADYTGNLTVTGLGQMLNVPVSFKDKYNGYQYGARIGAQYNPGLMLGFDLNFSSYSTKTTYSDGSAGDTEKYERSEIGAFLGFCLPYSIRVWYGHYMMDETVKTTNADSGSTAGDLHSGHSTEIGLGHFGLKYVSFNLLYRTMIYSNGNAKYLMSELGINEAYTLSPEYKAKEIVLGLSFPFTI